MNDDFAEPTLRFARWMGQLPASEEKPPEEVKPTPLSPTAAALFERPLPPGYRDELRDLEAAPQAAVESRAGSMLLFRIGDVRLALPTRVATAVTPVLHLARIPHRSGTVLLGLAAFRGEILPCCSLSRILDLPLNLQMLRARLASATARMLVLEESPGRLWVAPIDAVLGVRQATREVEARELPIPRRWVRSSFQDDGGEFHLLDAGALFRQIALATA
jgi:chemotaxis-related protein WspD